MHAVNVDNAQGILWIVDLISGLRQGVSWLMAFQAPDQDNGEPPVLRGLQSPASMVWAAGSVTRSIG